FDCLGCLLDRLDDEAGNAMLDDLSNRSSVKGNYRSAAGHGLNHGEPKRLRPADGKKECPRISEKVRFVALANFSNELGHWGALQQGSDAIIEIAMVGIVNFCSHA